MQKGREKQSNVLTRLRGELHDVQTDWQQPLFIQLVRAFAAVCPDTFGCTFKPYARKIAAKEELIAMDGVVEFSNFQLIFQFSAVAQASHNVLELLLCFDKTAKDAFFYTLYDVFNLFGIPDFRCYTFGELYNEELLQKAFESLCGALEEYLPRIADIGNSPAQKRKLQELLNDDYFISFRQPLKDVVRHPALLARSINLFYSYRRGMHLSGACRLLCRGKMEKALKKLRHSGSLCLYQQRLLAWLEEEPKMKADSFLPPELQKATEQGEKILPRLLPVLLYTILLTVPFYLLFYTLFYAAEALLGINNLYVLHLTPNVFLLPSLFSAYLFLGYFRHCLIIFPQKEKRKRRLAIDWMLNGKKNRRIYNHLTAVFFMLLFIFFVFYADCNVIFKQDGLLDNNAIFSIQGEYIPYANVQALVVVPPIILGDGRFLTIEYYQLQLKDGREISLRRYDPWRIQEHVIPLLKEQGGIELPKGFLE